MKEREDMNKEIKLILNKLQFTVKHKGNYICDDEHSKILLDYITNLQQENERLKEENNNKAMNDYAHAIDESWYRELYDDYKSRCEKAIEYIKQQNVYYGFCDNLLNILQGSEEND